jgi:hypothetical protein
MCLRYTRLKFGALVMIFEYMKFLCPYYTRSCVFFCFFVILDILSAYSSTRFSQTPMLAAYWQSR